MTGPTACLHRQADDDRGDAHRGEQSTDVGAPHPGEQQAEADDDDDEPAEIDEDGRQAFSPTSRPRLAEQRGVGAGQREQDDEEAEDGRGDPRPGRVHVGVVELIDQHDQCQRGQNAIAQQQDRPRVAAARRLTSHWWTSVRISNSDRQRDDHD